MTHLLDTSVCSQPLKRRPLRHVLSRWDRLGPGRAATSICCLAEIEWGLHKLASERCWSGYRRVVLPSVRTLPSDGEVWKKWSSMKARQHAIGRPVDDLDLLIAATAVAHGLTLASLNVRHFSLIEGLRWEDWSAPDGD
jgi:predicted nucleic acid-binding protein